MVVQQEKDDKKQQELAEKYHDRGIDLCYVDSDFDKALVQLHKAVNLRESILGKYHNDTALSYFRIASVLREEKKSNFEALVVARREFRISQKIIGSPTVSLMTSSDEWKRERMQWIKEVLIGTNAISEPQDLKLYCSQLLQAVEFERVGDRHSNCKEWESAIIQYNSALILETSAYARNVLDMADLQMKIGDCLKRTWDYDSAIEEFRNARIRYQDGFGYFHATTGKTFSKMADIYLKQQNFDAALASYSKAYSIYEEVFGKDHKASVETLQDIRLVTVKEMEYLREQERVRAAKTGRKKSTNGKHPL